MAHPLQNCPHSGKIFQVCLCLVSLHLQHLLLSVPLSFIRQIGLISVPETLQAYSHFRVFALVSPLFRIYLHQLLAWEVPPSFNSYICSNAIFSKGPPLTTLPTTSSHIPYPYLLYSFFRDL